MTLPTRIISVDVYHGFVCAFLRFQDEMEEVQDSVSQTTLPVNISVLSSTWQQFGYSVDVCHVN
jgi:hypothetical protein